VPLDVEEIVDDRAVGESRQHIAHALGISERIVRARLTAAGVTLGSHDEACGLANTPKRRAQQQSADTRAVATLTFPRLCPPPRRNERLVETRAVRLRGIPYHAVPRRSVSNTTSCVRRSFATGGPATL